MLLVVIVHTLHNSYGHVGQEMIRFFCLCYTMPMFTFISGYFSKPTTSFRKNVTSLLFPCLLFTLINDGVQLLVCPNYQFSWTILGFSMWYLWALFIYRVSLRYLLKIPYVIPLTFVLTWIVGLFPQINVHFSLSRVFCFLPYFLLGYKIANNSRWLCCKALNNKMLYGGVLLLAFVVWEIFIYYFPGYTIATGFNSGYGLSVMGLLLRISLQVTILITGYCVIQVFPNKELWFTKYGKRTMNVYLLHGIIVLPFAYQVFPPFAEADWFVRIWMILLPTVFSMALYSQPIDTMMKKILGVVKK